MALTISYIDPGYGAGIDGVTCVENETYNPINGVAFTKEGGGTVTLPVPSDVFAFDLEQNKFVTVRFSVYLDSSSFTVSFLNASTNNLLINQNGFYNIAYSKHAWFVSTKVTGSNPAQYTYAVTSNTITDVDGNSSTANLFSSTSKLPKYITSDMLRLGFGTALNFIFINSGECYVSNVIVTVGTEALSSGSFPVKLPLKDTSGDFISLGGGEYVGNTAGQKLLSVVDAQDVIQKFGASSKVSHLVSYGYPGYRVGANITNATGISEENSSIAAHGSCALSTDTDASAAVVWAVDNTRLSDVDGMKIGWQV